jgi:hypothetical protein
MAKAKYEAKRVINGTFGTVEIDGEDIMEVVAFQAKDEYGKEAISQCGVINKGYKITSIEGKGSVKVNKINSRMIKKIGRQIREGKTPTFTLTGTLADPDSFGSEKIAFTGVIFDDLTLFDFENGTLGTVEMPFTYEDFMLLDLI